MLKDFYHDLQAAKKAEKIVKDTFSALAIGFAFEDVSEAREYFYKGDIKATDPLGRETFIEVKDDSRIAETKNILCEYEVYYKENDYYSKGNMHSNYDVYCIVSQAERKIYVLDFKILKEIYKKGQHRVIPHAQQDTYCYLLPISIAKRYGAMIAELEY